MFQIESLGEKKSNFIKKKKNIKFRVFKYFTKGNYSATNLLIFIIFFYSQFILK